MSGQPMRGTATKQMVPTQAYLAKKRKSVFSNPYDESEQEIAENYVPPRYEKTQRQIDTIISVLNNSFLAMDLSHQLLTVIALAMKERTYTGGQDIVTYGDLGFECFILDEGAVDIIVYKDGTSPKDPELNNKIAFTKYLDKPFSFGEIALLYNDKRTATVRANTDCKCYVLDGKTFKYILVKKSFQKKNLSPEFLESIDLFNNLDRYEKLKLINMLSIRVFQKGEYVFKEGDEGDNFYMIEEGQVECVKKLTDSTGFVEANLKHIRDLMEGQHFGELALLTPGGKGKRSLSIRCKTDQCKLLYLNRDDFTKIVGNISQYLKMNYGGEYDKQFSAPQQSQEQASKEESKMRVQVIPGFDATIMEEKSGGESNPSIPSGRNEENPSIGNKV